jgi:hypothetical protein
MKGVKPSKSWFFKVLPLVEKLSIVIDEIPTPIKKPKATCLFWFKIYLTQKVFPTDNNLLKPNRQTAV